MSIAKVTEVISMSKKSFDDAINSGIKRACKTLSGVKGAWVTDMAVEVDKNKVIAYRVRLKITFVLRD